MSQDPQIVPARTGVSQSLVDRLDPVLGEAASGIGAMLTELVRRTLRGGVQRVDEELSELAGEKVDGAVARRLPEIEAAAVQTAERTAQAVASREVAELDTRTTQATQRLAGELAETGVRLESQARELVGDLERRSTEATRALVTTEVSSLEQRATEATRTLVTTEVSSLERRAGDRLVTEIQTLEQRASETTRELVTTEVTEAERRAEEKARALVDSEVAELMERARTATQSLHKHVNALHEAHTELRRDVSREQEERARKLDDLDRELSSKALVLTEQVRSELERKADEWQRRWMASEAARRALTERIAELERPRGLRALTAKLFGKKKPDANDAPVETATVDAADSELEDDVSVESDSDDGVVQSRRVVP